LTVRATATTSADAHGAGGRSGPDGEAASSASRLLEPEHLGIQPPHLLHRAHRDTTPDLVMIRTVSAV
jgi:hypothetical protein